MRKIGSLPGRAAFRATRARGNVLDGKLLRFIYLSCPQQFPPIQIGTIVGRRYGHAVRRNFLRRRVREACRLLLDLRSDDTRASPLSISLVIVYRGPRLQAGSRVSFDDLKGDVAKFVNAVQNLGTGK